MERRPYGSNRDTTSGRTHDTSIEELGTCCICNGRDLEKHETTVRQKETEPTRTEGWQPRMVREQKYPVELTLKEVG